MSAGLAATLAATMAAQALATLAAYALPVLAPAAAADLGVSPKLLGAQVALVYACAAIVSLGAGALLARSGPARGTQAALAAAALALPAIALGGLWGAALGSVLLGLGYGLTAPAASLVLARVTPPGRRNLVFAVKQTGVPLGGALAGLLMPVSALLLGWRGALLGVAAALLLAVLALQRFRPAWDGPRPVPPAGGNAARVLRTPGLGALALIGALFSAVQLSLSAYAVTMLVGEFGWGAVAAGAAAAALLACGAVARVLWAMLADACRAGLPVLAAVGLGTAAPAMLLPFALDWPPLLVLLLLCLLGSSAGGWTGVAIAEVARLAPPGLAGAATGAVMGVTYGGVVAGPLLLAGLATLAGSYAGGFAAMALLALLGAAIAWRAHRAERRRSGLARR